MGIEAIDLINNLHKKFNINYQEEWWPGNRPPFSFRGFHIDEMTSLCLDLGYAVIALEKEPMLTDGKDYKSIPTKIHNYLPFYEGVLISNTHAVAWDTRLVFDPSGIIYPIDRFDYNLFFIVKRLVN